MKPLNRLYKFFVLLALAASSLTVAIRAHAQEAPDMLVKRVSQEVLDAVKDDKELQSGITVVFSTG